MGQNLLKVNLHADGIFQPTRLYFKLSNALDT